MRDDELHDIFNANPVVSTAVSAIIGIALIGDLTAQEQNALGNWFMLLAQVLVTNSTSQNIIQSRTEGIVLNINSKKIKSVYNPLFYDIKTLQEVLKSINKDSYQECINLFSKSFNKINEELNKLKN